MLHWQVGARLLMPLKPTPFAEPLLCGWTAWAVYSPSCLSSTVIPGLQVGRPAQESGTCPKHTASTQQSWGSNPDRSSFKAVLKENSDDGDSVGEGDGGGDSEPGHLW